MDGDDRPAKDRDKEGKLKELYKKIKDKMDEFLLWLDKMMQ
jgi:hypothetical protein